MFEHATPSLYAVNAAQRKLMGKGSVPQYKPDFTKACDHFLIHAGRCT